MNDSIHSSVAQLQAAEAAMIARIRSATGAVGGACRGNLAEALAEFHEAALAAAERVRAARAEMIATLEGAADAMRSLSEEVAGALGENGREGHLEESVVSLGEWQVTVTREAAEAVGGDGGEAVEDSEGACTACNGTGLVDAAPGDIARKLPCDHCGMTGKEPPAEEEKEEKAEAEEEETPPSARVLEMIQHLTNVNPDASGRELRRYCKGSNEDAREAKRLFKAQMERS